MYLTENLQDKWQPVLEHPDLPKIGDAYKRAVTTVILENQEKAVREDRSFMSEAAPANATGSSVDNWDPVLISLVRRAMPNLIAYDICGVQPMTGPTGLIFAMKSRFTGTQAGELKHYLTKLILIFHQEMLRLILVLLLYKQVLIRQFLTIHPLVLTQLVTV